MIGYKGLRKGLHTRYGDKLEIGKTYISENVKWNKEGYHLCTYPEDTLRYIIENKDDGFVITLVEANGTVEKYDDEYYGYYDMFVCSKLTIVREVSRKEFINMIYNSNNPDRICRLISSIKLTEEEINLFRGLNYRIDEYIDYYQYGIKDAFQRKLTK